MLPPPYTRSIFLDTFSIPNNTSICVNRIVNLGKIRAFYINKKHKTGQFMKDGEADVKTSLEDTGLLFA